MMKSSIYDALDMLIDKHKQYEKPCICMWRGFAKELNNIDVYKGVNIYYLSVIEENKMYIGENCFMDA